MEDDSIRKMVEITDAAVEAGRRLRESDPLSFKLAEQARKSIEVASQHSALRDLAYPYSAMLEFAQQDRLARERAIAFAQPLGSHDLLESMRKAEMMIPRLAIGPIAEMRDAGLFVTQQRVLRNSVAASFGMLERFEAGFRLPSSVEAARLVTQFDYGATAQALSFVTESTSVLAAMKRMRTPWLDTANPLISCASFAAIQGMAHAIVKAPSFDVDIASALRLELGDWRDPIVWPEEIFHDLQARSVFYGSLGVNPVLTAMPAPAFRETLEVAGLLEPSTDIEEVVDDRRKALELGFGRTNEAHDRLQRLEVEIRLFIEAVLSAEYGDEWLKRSVPDTTLEEWKQKQAKARRHTDTIYSLIFYADFTDYERIMCRKDNWKHFEPYFKRKESLLESFQRLYPIRIDTMHARMITQDDELFLLVEYKRMTRALRKLKTDRRNEASARSSS
jgi:hypothetical protein